MSDNIPFEIQLEIIKKVPDVKTLIRCRSVSKPWRSFTDSSDFIAGYGSRDTQPQSLLLRYRDNVHPYEVKYVSFVDDENNDTLNQQQDFAANVLDIMKQFNDSKVIGPSHGLFCLYSHNKEMLVLWNPSLKKSVGIALPKTPLTSILLPRDIFGFAVSPVTNDPTVVMISYPNQVAILH
ncbi:integrase, catalytic region, zinc finger, CCHC-type containing protein [Tanacetum coccineum]